MGILSDILEDNREKAGQLFSVAALVRATPTSVPLPLLFSCPLCAGRFSVERELQTHILVAHRRLQAYLKLNDQVIQDLCYIEEPIHRLLVLVLGEQSALIRLLLDGRRIRETKISPGRSLELANSIQDGFAGTIRIEIGFGSVAKEHTIYCRTQPPMNTELLDQAVGWLEAPLLEGREPDWAGFRREHFGRSGNTHLERRYLEGFYEYVLGSYLELSGNARAGEHLETAYGYTRPFATALAHTARCLVGIKMNWFHLLDHCGPRSVFYQARLFFRSAIEDQPELPVGTSVPKSQEPRGVWVDPFTEALLMSIDKLVDGDFGAASTFIKQLENSPLGMTRNNEDKLWLLKARLAMAQSEITQARDAYKRLEHHPIFGKEAAKHL